MINTMNKVIDREFLVSYYKEMVNEIGEIFELFLEEMPGDFAILNEKISSNNFSGVAEVLHKIAPCFYNVGLPQLTKEVKAIEASIHEGNTGNISERVMAFQDEYNEYLPAIIEESNRLNATEI
jgi:HPt (histidine-containing phosphotransfer) domain-containing protein